MTYQEIQNRVASFISFFQGKQFNTATGYMRTFISTMHTIMIGIGSAAMYSGLFISHGQHGITLFGIASQNPVIRALITCAAFLIRVVMAAYYALVPYSVLKPKEPTTQADEADDTPRWLKALIILNTVFVYSWVIAFQSLRVAAMLGMGLPFTAEIAVFAWYYLAGLQYTYNLNSAWAPSAYKTLKEAYNKGELGPHATYMFFAAVTALSFALLSFHSSTLLTQMMIIALTQFSQIQSIAHLTQLAIAAGSSVPAFFMGAVGFVVTLFLGIPLLMKPCLTPVQQNDDGAESAPRTFTEHMQKSWEELSNRHVSFQAVTLFVTALSAVFTFNLALYNPVLSLILGQTARSVAAIVIATCSVPLQFQLNKGTYLTVEELFNSGTEQLQVARENLENAAVSLGMCKSA